MSQLAILGGTKVIQKEAPHLIWPHITESTEQAVIQQLHETISIYDRSGVIEEFENAFAHHHGRQYALLSNSGTSAIHSMYEGLGLGPGDEVICPVYTFFATVSPLMHTGAIPVFCDCGPDGNIDPVKIEDLVTPSTKAIVVTHMWGIPCDMNTIVDICQKYDLCLLEDCSHAHGARVNGKLVGKFGEAAAWSLQAQKTITGGEGGIMLTDDEEIYYRALLQGHYNKRCEQEIPPDYPLAVFNVTGFGLKLRAHPLAVAIAQEQFPYLSEWLNQRQYYAEKMTAAFDQFPFLRTPLFSEKHPGWYAYVMQFDASCANRVSIDIFTKAVLAEGLVEFDRPGSTRPLHVFSLFSDSEKALPRLYSSSVEKGQQQFPMAEQFYMNALKLPVWSLASDEQMVNLYIDGIVKVASAVKNEPDILLDIATNE